MVKMLLAVKLILRAFVSGARAFLWVLQHAHDHPQALHGPRNCLGASVASDVMRLKVTFGLDCCHFARVHVVSCARSSSITFVCTCSSDWALATSWVCSCASFSSSSSYTSRSVAVCLWILGLCSTVNTLLSIQNILVNICKPTKAKQFVCCFTDHHFQHFCASQEARPQARAAHHFALSVLPHASDVFPHLRPFT